MIALRILAALALLAACATPVRAPAPTTTDTLPTDLQAELIGVAGPCLVYRLAGDPELVVVATQATAYRCGLAVQAAAQEAAEEDEWRESRTAPGARGADAVWAREGR